MKASSGSGFENHFQLIFSTFLRIHKDLSKLDLLTLMEGALQLSVSRHRGLSSSQKVANPALQLKKVCSTALSTHNKRWILK